MSTPPFTPARVVLFLLLCLVGVLLIYGIFALLVRARGRQTVVPHSSRLQLYTVPIPASAELSARYV